MIRKITHSVLAKYYRRVTRFAEEPLETQQRTFEYLIAHGKKTLFGKENRFHNIYSPDYYRRNIPIFTYEDLRPYLDRIIVNKEQNVLWDSPVKWFAMSSGTVQDKSKYIPITQESLKNCHYRCGHHMLGMYAAHRPDAAFLLGKSLVLGGSRQINSIGSDIFTGDISAILLKNLPFFARMARTPESIALIPDWEDKLDKLVKWAVKANIRSMVGVPSWMLVLLKKINEETGKSISDLFPNLEVFFHGGVSFTPYEEQYKKLIPSDRMCYWETYNASEGFFGIQYTPQSKDMLLLLDNEIYYEFLPVSEWNKPNPIAIPLAEVETGTQYAIIITTSGGLWRYALGDTVEFTSTSPYLFRITGRTKQYINAFGEELIVDNAERALCATCNATGAKVIEYTVAPVYFGDSNNGAHEWLIEFETPPENIDLFIDTLDTNLMQQNSDYEAKRSHDLSLSKPLVKVMEKNTFYEWMKSREKAGGQNKVPKLSNDRKHVDSILQYVSTKCS